MIEKMGLQLNIASKIQFCKALVLYCLEHGKKKKKEVLIRLLNRQMSILITQLPKCDYIHGYYPQMIDVTSLRSNKTQIYRPLKIIHPVETRVMKRIPSLPLLARLPTRHSPLPSPSARAPVPPPTHPPRHHPAVLTGPGTAQR